MRERNPIIDAGEQAESRYHSVDAARGSDPHDNAGLAQAILDAMLDGVITLGAQGVVETLNPAARNIFGYTGAEGIGRNIKMLLHQTRHGEHDDLLGACRADGEARVNGIRREILGKRKDGSTFPLELALSEMRLNGERHYTGIVRDLSEQRQFEHQLNLFFEVSLDILVILAGNGYFMRVSPAFTRTLGWSIEEALARPFIEFVHPEDRAATIRVAERMKKLGEHVLQFENRYMHKDGSWRVLSWRAVPQEGGLFFGNARDVTAAKEAQQSLVASKDDFLATMSHEIRTPLNGLLGMLELLSLWQLDGEQGETLAMARESGRSLVRIIDDILDFTKISAGKLEIQAGPTSIAEIQRHTVNTFHAVASAKNLKLQQTMDPRISPSLLADQLRVSQILNNLVSNALKFTSEGGVEIRAELMARENGADTVRLSVKDTGIGMDSEVQKRLFQPFEQAVAFTACRYGGTGLGLSISRRLAEMMGGTIEVKSAPGKGTTMSVLLTLPISDVMPAEPESTEATVTPMRVGASAGAAPLVLAVDDHSTNRNLLARQITALGLRAQTAEDGVEALAIWQEGAVALVVTDCNMPQMDGYALSRAIREIETNKGLPRTPIIAWTANVLPAAVALCRSAEMDDMLTKPAGLAALKETLSKWLPSAPIVAFAAENTADAELKPIPGAAIKLAALDRMATTAQERAEILLDFMIQTRNDAVGLRAAVAVQNLPYQVRIAHRMKGSSRMVGAQDLAAACEAIETAPGKCLPEGAMAAIDRALEQLEAHLVETTRVSGEQR